MKLFEIDLTPKKSVQSYRDVERGMERAQEKGKTKQLGKAGVSATAWELPGDVRKALKVGHTHYVPPQQDAYLDWLKTVENKPNPFFPQVEKTKVFTRDPGDDQYADYHFQVKMEHLYPFKDITTDEAHQLWTRYFGLSPQQLDQLDRFVEREGVVMRQPKGMVHARYFSKVLSNIVQGRDPSMFDVSRASENQPPKLNIKITDTNLREALQTLLSIKHKHNTDIHQANILLRRTPYGVQPVFTDPFQTRTSGPHVPVA